MTFDEWYEQFQRAFYKGAYPHQRYGQAFSNALMSAGRVTQANSLCYAAEDPWEKDYVSEDVKAYLRRVWDWGQG